MRGLDPRIHQKIVRAASDCRIKPGNDDGMRGGLVDAVLEWRSKRGSHTVLLDRDHALDLVGDEADGRRVAHAGQNRDVEQFPHHAFDAQPLDRVAAVDVDHEQAAALRDLMV
jgi:hypothetical protein